MESEKTFLVQDETTGQKYYGGNQSWFELNTRARSGCGHVAGINSFLTLTGGFPIEKSKYITLMNEMYRTMGAIEVPILNRIYNKSSRDAKFFKKITPNFGQCTPGYILGMLRYSKKHGLRLKPHLHLTFLCSHKKGLDFIRDGLKKNGCVTMLTSHNRHPLTVYSDNTSASSTPSDYKGGMKNHFVTITDIEENQGRVKLLISTWGRIASVDYDDLVRSWHRPGALQSAMFYFTPRNSP